MAEELPTDQTTEPKKKRYRRPSTPKKKMVKTADLPDSIEIFERFREIVDYLLENKIMKSKYQFANKHGIGLTTFNLKSNNKTPSIVPSAFLAILVKEFGVSAHWLLTGEGPMIYKIIKADRQDDYTFLDEVKEFDIDTYIPQFPALWINKPLKIYKKEGSMNYFLFDSQNNKLYEFESGEYNPLTKLDEYKKVVKAYREKFKPRLDYTFIREVKDFKIDELKSAPNSGKIKFFKIYMKTGVSTFFLHDQRNDRLFEFVAINPDKIKIESEQRKVVKEYKLIDIDSL